MCQFIQGGRLEAGQRAQFSGEMELSHLCSSSGFCKSSNCHWKAKEEYYPVIWASLCHPSIHPLVMNQSEQVVKCHSANVLHYLIRKPSPHSSDYSQGHHLLLRKVTDLGWFHCRRIKFECAINSLTSESHWFLIRIHFLLFCFWYNTKNKLSDTVCYHFFFFQMVCKLFLHPLYLWNGQKHDAKTAIKPLNIVTMWSFAANWKVIFNRKRLSGHDNQRGGEWLALH